MTSAELDAAKGRVVRKVFVDTADDNYVGARWCFYHGLSVDFHWLAVHALEKYLKAVLLLNDKSAKGYGHNIERLYCEVHPLAFDLLPKVLEQSSSLDTKGWHDEEPERFLRRLYAKGEANNRYDLFGFVQMRHDLFKLDQMVFAVRRLCRPLDAMFFPGRPEQGTNREVLNKQPEWWSLRTTGKLEKTVHGKRGSELRRVLLNCNPLLAPDDFEHEPVRSSTSASNSILGKEIVKPLKGPAGQSQEVALDLREWVLNKIKLPPDVQKELRDAGP